ncbi:citrate lyase subunit beta [candidate division KSB3 bacterium]|uniref:Citrate lyase subunit beta n=1 Tax=candidate division KSB3 bacterium TaxID=2044937 RepID=A0A2G6E537_9BACT|nr:MAG: citrate lyase subunit beta [candidate division KSB3 bacterium]PIE29636.1 MAG: citrate lyase subunit beta [candidate division KSB3 bacterium]
MKLRRTMLYAPGNNPALLKDAHIYGSDAVMFDLEDAVSLAEKDAARLLVFHILRTVDMGQTERVVRINGLDTKYGQEDIRALVRARPDVIRIPKTKCAQTVHDVEELVEKGERSAGIAVGSTKLMAALEGPTGVLNAPDIAVASQRLIGIALGAEDYATSLATTRSKEGTELYFARSMVVNAARSAGIYALDTVFADLEDEDGFRKEVQLIKQLGFDGKSIISPRQIAIVHEEFSPTRRDIEHARRVIAAREEAGQKHSGVIALDGKMIDKPIVDRAHRTLELARMSGFFPEEGECYGDK